MGMAVKNMSLSVYADEVVGIAGLTGSGRTGIAKVIYGALKRNLINGGTIRLRGKPIRYRVPRQAINDGIAYITEDRKAKGFFETIVVDDNVYFGKLATKAGISFMLSRAKRGKVANYWVERLKINAPQRKAKIIEQPAEGGAG
jgi:ABC-type sugar transport system ATPase subunit